MGWMNMIVYIISKPIWRPPSLSELTPIIFDIKLNHLGPKVFVYVLNQ